MDEFELIRRFFDRGGDAPGVVTGIGDDGAILAPETGRDLVTVVDTLVAGTHFPATATAADIGYRSVAVNLSDIAAMGARPRWMTLALTLNTGDADWVSDFARGLHAAGDEHGVALIGGDTTAGDCLVVTVQVTGDVETGAALTRSGASPGDAVFVTGTLGDAAAGLAQWDSESPDPYLRERLMRPTARVSVGEALVGRATAAIDVSDGLFGDLDKLLTASGVGAEIELEQLPVSDTLARHFDAVELRRFALTGGDDYELCFTAAPDRVEPMVAGVPVTRIGTVTASPGLRCFEDNQPVTFADSGYRHFA